MAGRFRPDSWAPAHGRNRVGQRHRNSCIPRDRRSRRDCLPCTGSAGPVVMVIGVVSEAGGELDTMCSAPFGDLRVWQFVTQPDVVAVWEVLPRHCRQRPLRHGPRLRRGAGDDERDSQRWHRQLLVGPAQSVSGGNIGQRLNGEVQHQRAGNNESHSARPVFGPQPPPPERHDARKPAHAETCNKDPVPAAQSRHECLRAVGPWRRTRGSQDGPARRDPDHVAG